MPGVIHGFLDNHGHFTTVDAPGAPRLNSSESTILASRWDSTKAALHGVVYNSHTHQFTTLDDPNGVGTTTLNGINDLGQIVGLYVDSHGNTDGLLATPTLVGIPGSAMTGHLMHV